MNLYFWGKMIWNFLSVFITRNKYELLIPNLVIFDIMFLIFQNTQGGIYPLKAFE